MVRSLLRRWLRRLFTPAGRPGPRRSGFRPTLEHLETRLTPSVAFAPQATFTVGATNESEAVGDFNGDGRPDLAVVDSSSKTVSVLLNTTLAGSSAPSFAPQTTFTVGNDPISVAVGDFNGDGRPDLVVANFLSNTVSVLLNTTATGASAPTFAPQATFTVGANPISVAVGDFNGDGRPDLAVANEGAGTASVLLNTTAPGASAPTFAPQTTFTVGATPRSVAVGDFNGDGRPDLAVANEGAGTASVLLNTTAAGAAAPTFAPQATFTVGANPISVAVGDFNGDGRPDLAVANLNGGTASVLLNTTAAGASAPTFAPQATFTVGANPISVAVGDFNGDGRPDLAVANAGDGTASVLLNTTAAGASAPTFAPQATFTVGFDPHSVAVGDFNGDGRPDLAVANHGDGTASVLLNTAAPFATTTPVVVAEFGSSGVWQFNRAQNAWVQLTAGNATMLADDPNGDVVGEFPHYGIWEYRAATATWTQLNGTDVAALTMDALGDVTVTFSGMGVWEYRPVSGTPTRLNVSDAYLLAMDALGNVFADFRGYGINEYRAATGGWSVLNGTDATLLSVNATGEVVVNFVGYGVATYTPATGWQLLTSHQAQALAIDPLGDVAGSFAGPGGGPPNATFPGVGTGVYRLTGGWSAIPSIPAAALEMSASGGVFAEFTGYGVWEFDSFQGWVQRPFPGGDATVLAVA